MTPLNNFFDHLDLTDAHFIGCFLGVILCLWVAQLFSTDGLHLVEDTPLSFQLRRASLMAIALSLCWAMTYSSAKGWQPWPPDVFVVFSFDALLASSVLMAYRRRKNLAADSPP